MSKKTFIKRGADEMKVSVFGVPKRFQFPYTTEDLDEQQILLANGAEERIVVPEKTSAKKPVPEEEGE